MITSSTHASLRLSRAEAEALHLLLQHAQAADFPTITRDHHRRALVRVLKRLAGQDGKNYWSYWSA